MDKKPRHYMMSYFAAGDDRVKQQAALVGCPVEWQDLVRKHITIRKEKMVKGK